jgi:CubicO group peptidase (beta-lactamase class C family)
MFLNVGKANGKHVVPADWVKEATVPDEGYEPIAPGETLGYQYQWWTFADSDAYAAMGLHHQYIYVDSANDMVIVKITYTAEPVGRDEENLQLFGQITQRLGG